MNIEWAVIPVAGLGTRMLPMTKTIAKELIPVVDRPLIDWIVDEVKRAGITNIVFVSHPTRKSIKQYFTRNIELEQDLHDKIAPELFNMLQHITPPEITIHYASQDRPLGLGHAIHCAFPVVGNKPFAVLLPDVLLRESRVMESRAMESNAMRGSSTLLQMVQQFNDSGQSQILVENVPREKTLLYGIIEVDNNTGAIKSMIEKPAPESAPSTLSIVGRYVFTPKIWGLLGELKSGAGGELQLTDAINELLQFETVEPFVLKERSFDCGNKLGYLSAILNLALDSEEYGDALKHQLKHFI